MPCVLLNPCQLQDARQPLVDTPQTCSRLQATGLDTRGEGVPAMNFLRSALYCMSRRKIARYTLTGFHSTGVLNQQACDILVHRSCCLPIAKP
jgi:hypothetical protein